MNNSDPRFRTVIADVEKASTGEALRNALVTYTEPDLGPHISSDFPNPYGIPIDKAGWSGAIQQLNYSHLMNINELTDASWFIDPDIHPGDQLVDFNPDYKYIDQDGNKLDF